MARRRFQKGSLVLRGTIWYGRWWDSSWPRKRVCMRLGTQSELTRHLAQRELQKHLDRVNSTVFRPAVEITFSEFSVKWEQLMLPNLKRSTQLAYTSMLRKHLNPLFGNRKLAALTPEVIQRAIVGMIESSPKTIKNAVMLLRAMFRDAIKWSYLYDNPCDRVTLPAMIEPERPAFTLEEVQAILEAAKEPHRTFYWLAVETGMRAGELCGLRLGDVHVSECVVQVRQSVWRGRVQAPKSKASVRNISISQDLAEHLRAFAELGTPDTMRFLFNTRRGSPWNADSVTKKHLAPLCQTLGIEAKGLHAFRRTHATLMDRFAVPLKVRQERMGHSDPRLTLTAYTRPVSEDERQFVVRMGSALNERRN